MVTAARNSSGVESAYPATIISPPPADRLIDVWPQPVFVPDGAPAPAWWLVGAHGGAGVSSLSASWVFAGDAMGAFPGGFDEESPFVLVVAREHAQGIGRAHDLITQHLSGHGGPTTLVGLITVAAHPGKLAAPLRQRLEVVTGLVGDRHWRIPWIDEWISLTPDELPSWTPGDPIPTGRKQPPAAAVVPRAVAATGEAIRSSIVSLLNPDN
ncbi:hypothetical protein GS493_23485 [Rhodococcus hoagii]|nr:hypothetical protein [Prescottella equi]